MRNAVLNLWASLIDTGMERYVYDQLLVISREVLGQKTMEVFNILVDATDDTFYCQGERALALSEHIEQERNPME